MEPSLTIVIPVYNEGANFSALWTELITNVSCEFTAIVVYDFDEDDTVTVVQQIACRGEHRLRAVKNCIKPGVVGAIRTGFQEASDGPILVVMADLSDDLAQVDRMVELYQQGYHVVAGSRYMKGGRIIDGPWLKQLLSRCAGVSLFWLRGVPTHDATNAFKIYDRDMLNTFNIESHNGFEINLELTIKAFLGGYRIVELPVTWRNRIRGQSRFRMWQWIPRYLKWYLYAFQPPKIRF
jgi:dolichol-phosphate mannosyltransferase